MPKINPRLLKEMQNKYNDWISWKWTAQQVPTAAAAAAAYTHVFKVATACIIISHWWTSTGVY
jgi:hypothetical protein